MANPLKAAVNDRAARQARGGTSNPSSMPLSEPIRFVSLQAFAHINGVSIATVRRYLKAGRLAFVQPAGRRCRILIPLDAVSHLMLQTQTTSQRTVSATEIPGPPPRWRKRPRSSS